MTEHPDLSRRLDETFGFFARCSPELQRQIADRSRRVALQAGQTICLQGAECQHLALVLSGSARVFKLAESGRELTLYRISPGESCILTASCIVSARPFPAFAECERPLEAVLIPGPDVVRWIAESVPWRDYLFGLIADRLADVLSLVEEVAFRRVDRRLAAYLADRGLHGGGLVSTTHQQIASELGSSREVISRIVKDFEAQGLVKAGRGQIRVLAPSALSAKAEEP